MNMIDHSIFFTVNSYAILLYGSDNIAIDEIRLRLGIYMILNEEELMQEATRYECFQQISFHESVHQILKYHKSLNQLHILALSHMLNINTNVYYPDIPGRFIRAPVSLQ